MAPDDNRTLDVVVFGATGFTGRLVCEYLAIHAPKSLKWALAGRSRGKLGRLRGELSSRWPAVAEVPIVIADSFDVDSLKAMAKKTRVVCTTVGPYATYGDLLVAACAEQGTDYCDLTGETTFIRATIDRHHDAATASGARIVHCYGFDSIPSDLGTCVLQDHALRTYDQPAGEVTLYLWGSKGGISGGTLASMTTMMDAARADPSVRKLLFDPYGLNPEGQRQGPDGRDLMGAEYDAAIGAWVGPFIMAGINTRVVRRTNALLDYRYGRQFRYREVVRFGRGLKGRATATGFSLAMGAAMGAMAVPQLRGVVSRWLPDSGEGPDEQTREQGFFECRVVGTVSGHAITVIVRGEKDPGYGATAIMLAESAMCLAKDRSKTPKTSGITTPAASMGMVLVDRLRTAGMTFAVDSSAP